MIGFRTIAVELDDALIVQAINDAGDLFLRRVGYETMQAARQSIRRGAGPSRPGDPPRDKTGTLRRFIRYAVDAQGQMVLIGPEYLPRQSQHAPRALESGGVSVTAQGDKIRIQARPFMRPAFAAAIAKTLPRLQDSLQGTSP